MLGSDHYAESTIPNVKEVTNSFVERRAVEGAVSLVPSIISSMKAGIEKTIEDYNEHRDTGYIKVYFYTTVTSFNWDYHLISLSVVYYITEGN